MNKFIVWCYIISVAYILSACSSSKVLDLKLAPQSAQSFVYRTKQTTNTDVTVMGMPQSVSMEQSTDQQFDILKVNSDGSLDLKVTYKTVKIDQDLGMMTMKFDSEHPENNEPAEMVENFKNLIGKSMEVKMSNKGEVLDFKTKGSLFEGVFDNVPNGETMEAQMEAQFGEESMKQALSQMVGFYPEKPVKVGDTWTMKRSVKAGMTMDIETTYTLKSRKSGVAFLDFSGKVKTDPSNSTIEMMGMNMSYDLAGTQKGTIEVDEKTGWVIKTTATQDVGGKMMMKGSPMGDMNADMKIKTVYTYDKID
jgi:hypothetical protein